MTLAVLEQERRPGVISAIVRIFLGISVQIVAAVILVIYLFLTRRQVDAATITFEMIVALSVVSAVSLFALSLPIPSFEGPPDWLRRPGSWWFLLGFGIGSVPIIFVANFAISAFQQLVGIRGEQSLLTYFRDADDLVLVVLFVIIAAIFIPVAEESFFRGFLVRAFSGLGVVPAVLLSSILFSVSHIEPVAILPTFLLGLLFAVARVKSGTIWPGVIAHSLNNFIALMLVRYFGG